MTTMLLRSSPRRAAAAVQHIRSPLTRAGYTLAPDTGHLVLLFAGRLSVRDGAAASAPLAEDARVIWLAGGGRELVAEGGTRAVLVSLPALVLAAALPASALGGQMGRTLGQDLSLPFDEAAARIATLAEGLEAELGSGEAGAETAAQHYASLILLQVWRLARSGLIAHGRAPQGLAERFVLMAGQRLHEHLKVSDFAGLLGVSRDRLGTAVRRATGLSPQGYLHRLLMGEAAELLASTGMPVGQIAFRLGFSDPAYFTRFFTRMSGQPPAQFRKTAKARKAQGDQSYAAWP